MSKNKFLVCFLLSFASQSMIQGSFCCKRINVTLIQKVQKIQNKLIENYLDYSKQSDLPEDFSFLLEHDSFIKKQNDFVEWYELSPQFQVLYLKKFLVDSLSACIDDAFFNNNQKDSSEKIVTIDTLRLLSTNHFFDAFKKQDVLVIDKWVRFPDTLIKKDFIAFLHYVRALYCEKIKIMRLYERKLSSLRVCNVSDQNKEKIVSYTVANVKNFILNDFESFLSKNVYKNFPDDHAVFHHITLYKNNEVFDFKSLQHSSQRAILNELNFSKTHVLEKYYANRDLLCVCTDLSQLFFYGELKNLARDARTWYERFINKQYHVFDRLLLKNNELRNDIQFERKIFDRLEQSKALLDHIFDPRMVKKYGKVHYAGLESKIIRMISVFAQKSFLRISLGKNRRNSIWLFKLLKEILLYNTISSSKNNYQKAFLRFLWQQGRHQSYYDPLGGSAAFFIDNRWGQQGPLSFFHPEILEMVEGKLFVTYPSAVLNNASIRPYLEKISSCDGDNSLWKKEFPIISKPLCWIQSRDAAGRTAPNNYYHASKGKLDYLSLVTTLIQWNGNGFELIPFLEKTLRRIPLNMQLIKK